MADFSIKKIIDFPRLQSLMDSFYNASAIPVGILAVDGEILVATGWQDICTKFHRVHPETCAKCRVSDDHIKSNLHVGKYIEYKCQNNMWDLATPIVIKGEHVATLFLGQFFYDDEVVEREFFRKQASKYGFPAEEYMAALSKVPTFSRQKVRDIMDYYTKFVQSLIDMGVANLELAAMRESLQKQVSDGADSLRESEGRYRTLFQENGAIMLLIEPGTLRVAEANDTACKFYGYAKRELLAKTMHEINVMKSSELERAAESVVKDSAGHFIFRHRLSSGEIRDVEVFSRNIVFGGSGMIFSIIHDISERVKAEESIKHSEAKWRGLFNILPVGVSVLGGHGNVVDFNPALGRILDITSEGLLSGAYKKRKYLHPDGAELLPDELPSVKAARENKKVENVVVGVLKENGETVWTSVSAAPLPFADASCVVVTADITEQKKREKALVETGDRLIEAQRIAKVGDWTWNLSNNALNWSDEMYEIFGLDKHSYTPSLEKYAELMHPDDRHLLLEVNYFDQINKENHVVEYRIIRGDTRETRYVLNTGESEFGPDGRPVFVRGTLQDITERKLMEIGLREAKTAAEEATRLKDKFVSLVSHDLKAPLSTMIGFVNLVRQYDNKALGENEKMLLDRAQESGRQMLNLIEELLRISRFKSGRLKVEKQFFDAKYLGAAMIANYSPIATQKGVALEDLIPPYSRVYADRALMTEAVQNLVTNAIKFCKSGDRVTISLGEGDFATICVSDTGRGMSGEFLKDIFKYEKITSTTGTAGEKGTGLGLPLTKDIMEIHGGSVAVESRPGKGSRFCLKLPFARPKVLIADDDVNFRQLQVWQLKTLNVEIIEAENGEEAFAKVVKEKPHLVITDIKMPVTDGLELLKKLKSEADTRDVPVIVVSGEYGMEFADQVFRLGGSDYVTKDKMTDADFLPRVRRFIS